MPVDHDKELKEIMERMNTAFHEFHAAIQELQHKQEDVISHIRKQIEQRKIDEIHTLLGNTNTKTE